MSTQKLERRTRDALVKALSGIAASGSFAARGTLSEKESKIDIGLTVNGAGNIQLPLNHEDATKLVSKSRLAPYGKGEETIVDKSVRNTWEIDAADVSFSKQPLWDARIDKMIALVKKGFGLADEVKVIAEPYKLLLYEKESKFEPHRDSEKLPAHFATLVVSFPSNHQGGGLRIVHAGQTKHFGTETGSHNRYQWLAWYTDAVHEVKPLTFGRRLVLTYNLCLASSPGSYLVFDRISTSQMEEGLRHVLTGWTSKPYMLWYMLDHQYSRRSLIERLLKGSDALRVSSLEAVGSNLGYKLLFAQIEKKVVIDYIKHNNDYTLTAQYLVDMDGESYCSTMEITENEVAQRNAFHGKPAHEQQHFTGNMGNWADYWYRDTAVLIVPPQNIASLQVRRWAGELSRIHRDQHFGPRTEPTTVIDFLTHQSTLIRNDRLQSADSNLKCTIETLLDDAREYHSLSWEYESDVQEKHRKAVPSGMCRSLDEIEMIGILTIQLGLTESFKVCCELLENQHKSYMDSLPALLHMLGRRLYEFGDVDSANLYMAHLRQDQSWSSQYNGIKGPTKTCDQICKGYRDAQLNPAISQCHPAVNVGLWQRLWYRDTFDAFKGSLENSSLLQLPLLVSMSLTLEDQSILTIADDWIKTEHASLSASTVTSILTDFAERISSIGVDTVRQYSLQVLKSAPIDKWKQSQSFDPTVLAKVGPILGPEVCAHIIDLLKSHTKDFACIVTFAGEALKHSSWLNANLLQCLHADLLLPASENFDYAKTKTSWRGHRVSDDVIRPQTGYGEISATVAEIKLLIEILQQMKEKDSLSRLCERLAGMQELDPDTFSDMLAAENLKKMKEIRAKSDQDKEETQLRVQQ